MTNPSVDIQSCDLRKEDRDGVGRPAPFASLRRHVQLLLDDGGTHGGEADDERDDLKVLRGAQERARASPNPTPFSLAAAAIASGTAAPRRRCRIVQTMNEQMVRSVPLHQQQLVRADVDRCRRMRISDPAMPPSGGAAADEPEQPFGLARIVDEVCDGPELADRAGCRGAAPRHRRPPTPTSRPVLEQEPEADEQRRHPELGDRQRRSPGQASDQPAVAGHQDPDDQAGDQQHVGQVVGAEGADEASTA